jgi:hypothetical protein
MVEDHTCFHEDDFVRMEKLVTKVFGRMDTFIEEIHTVIVTDTVRQGKIAQLERDLDRAFTDLRSLGADLKILWDWRQRFEGGVRVMLAIPVVCTIVTALISIYTLLHV